MESHIDELNQIYKALGDEISRKIYKSRIMFSLTEEDKYIRKITDISPIVQEFKNKMDSANKDDMKLIYGAGMRGKTIACYWKYDWRAFIDQNEKLWNRIENGLPIMSIEMAINRYINPIIVVTNKIEFEEIEENLIHSLYE